MKLRIIVKTIDATPVAHLNESALTTFRTFDIPATPEFSAHVETGIGDVPDSYLYRQIVGVEVIKDEEAK